MSGYKAFVIVVVTLIALCSLTNGATIDAEVDPEIDWGFGHQKFFQNLTAQEQKALMSMAISNYNYTNRPPNGDAELFPNNPMTKPGPEEIPRTLFTAMMNGKVPRNFMTSFNRWVKRKYGLTNAAFDRFATSESENRLCKDDTGEDCIRIEDIGSSCCPFG